MTRRQFDAATRLNFGGRMASDERADYRRVRGHILEVDGLAVRAREAAYHRAGFGSRTWAVLGIGSRFRAPVCVRLLGRWPTTLARRNP